MGEFKFTKPHFDIKTLAKSLKLASIDVIHTSRTDIESHWFRSVGPADLYFWKVKDRVVKHQISIYNQIVEWNEYDGVKTGYINDEEQNQTSTIQFDKEVNPVVIQQALLFLSEIQSIDPQIIHEFKEHYHFYSRWPLHSFFKILKGFWPFGRKKT